MSTSSLVLLPSLAFLFTVQLAEVFLDPSILGFDGPGIPELAVESATSSFDPVHKRAGGLVDINSTNGSQGNPNSVVMALLGHLWNIFTALSKSHWA